MSIRVCLLLLLTTVIVLGRPITANADALCNGNALAGGKLRAMTATAAATTLRAAADAYQMVAFLEEGPTKLGSAREMGRAAVSKLKDAMDKLEKEARPLPEAEFEKMTARITKLNYDQVAARLRIQAASPLWIDVARAASSGGRGWLAECIKSKGLLRTETDEFVRGLEKMPEGPRVWTFLAIWSQELARQRYLTMVLFE